MTDEKRLKAADIIRGIAIVLGVGFFYIAMMSIVSAGWQSLFLSRSGGVYSEAEYIEAFHRDSGYINIIFAALSLLVTAGYYSLKKRSLTDAANIRIAPMSKMGMGLAAGLSAQLPLGFIMMLIPFSQSILQGHDELMNSSTTPMVVQMLYGVILAPVIEEIFFRGIAHDRLAKVIHPVLAAAVSSAMFALIHGELLSIIVAFVAGFLMALLYNRYKTVLVPIAFHCGFNAMGYISAFIIGGMAELIALIISVAVLAVSLVLLLEKSK